MCLLGGWVDQFRLMGLIVWWVWFFFHMGLIFVHIWYVFGSAFCNCVLHLRLIMCWDPRYSRQKEKRWDENSWNAGRRKNASFFLQCAPKQQRIIQEGLPTSNWVLFKAVQALPATNKTGQSRTDLPTSNLHRRC